MQVFEVIMDFIKTAGASAILPIMITVLGLYFRMSFFQAFKNGLMIGIGFLGINTILGVLTGGISVISAYYTELGSGFTVTDIGWQGMSAAAWSTPFAVLVVPIGFVLNFLLLKYRFTKTLNVDVWNYWHFLLDAAILYYVLLAAGVSVPVAIVIGTIFALLCSVIMLKLADHFAPSWQEYFGVEGTAVTTQMHLTTIYPVAWITNKVISKIPGLNKIDFKIDSLQEKFGAFGDTSIVAFVVGLLLCIITRQDAATTLTTSVKIAGAIVIMPRMVSMLMEGLAPVGQAAQEHMSKKLGDDYEIYIGMDIALGLGDTCAMQTALVMIPITIAVAFIVPGVTYFPIATLGSLLYTTAVCSWVTDGNVFRTIVCATVMQVYAVITLSFISGLATTVVAAAGTMELTEGMKVVGSCSNQIYNVVIAIIAEILGII